MYTQEYNPPLNLCSFKIYFFIYGPVGVIDFLRAERLSAS